MYSHQYPQHVAVSAAKAKGIDVLLDKIEEILHRENEQLDMLIPFTEAQLLHVIRQYGKLEREEYLPEGIRVRGVLPRAWANKIQHQLNLRRT